MTFFKIYDNGEEVLLNATAIDKIIINEVEARTNGGEATTEYAIMGTGVRIPVMLFASASLDRVEDVFNDIESQIANGEHLIVIPEAE